jgi:hypothetical protein
VAYEIFCTEVPVPSGKYRDRCQIVTSDSLGAAIRAACKLITDGVIVWKLKGSDGFTMERNDIEIERLRRLGSSPPPDPGQKRDVREESSGAAICETCSAGLR